MTRVLLLMATKTYRASAFLRAAERLNISVTVASEREHVLAHLVPGASLAVDFRNLAGAAFAVKEFAARFPLDAVVSVDDEATILAAEISAQLCLSHNSVVSVQAARYKDVMRTALAETDLNTPWFTLVGIDEPKESVLRRVTYPCVVKPLALSGSRGVIRANTPAELQSALTINRRILADAGLPPSDPGASQVLIEGYVPGIEVAIEGLLVQGTLQVLAILDKPDILEGPYFEETIYVTPSRRPLGEQTAMVDCAREACAALGLREGPVHVELRWNDQGPWVIEVAPRSIGGFCSDALQFTFGGSLEELILRQAANFRLPELSLRAGAAGVMMIPIPREGILRKVAGLEAAQKVPGVQQVVMGIRPGQRVVPLPRGDRYLGFIFARGEDPGDVEAALRRAHGLLTFEISS